MILVTAACRCRVCGSFGFKLANKLRSRLASTGLVSSAPIHHRFMHACVIVSCNSSCDWGIIACVSCLCSLVFGCAGPRIAFGITKRNAAQRVPTMHVCCRPARPVGRPSAGLSQSGPAFSDLSLEEPPAAGPCSCFCCSLINFMLLPAAAGH